MTNNITLYKTGDTGTTVTVWTTKVEEDIAKDLGDLIQIPKTNSNDTNETKYIDLLKMKRVFTISGHISDYTDADKTLTAMTQRARLRALKDARSVDILYYATTYTGVLLKIKITESPTDESAPTVFDVTIQFMEGTNIIGVP